MQQKGGGLLEGEGGAYWRERRGLLEGEGGAYSIVQGYYAFSFFVKIL